MDYKEYITAKLDEYNLNELNGVLEDMGPQYGAISGNMSAESLISDILNGKPIFDSDMLIENMKDLFLLEIKASLFLCVEIVTVCILIGLLKSLSNSFGEKSISNLGIILCTCCVIALCLNNLTYAYEMCRNTVGTMTYTMQILLPILVPMLIAMGGVTSGAVLNPVIAGSVTVFNTLLLNIILPLIFVSTVFFLINGLTENDYVNKLAVFLRAAATFATGLFVTFFTGISLIQGFVTESTDGLLIKTARYSVNNLVPVVGNFATDSVDLILGCMKIMKNGISIFGVIIIIVLLIVPLIKLLSIAVLYKITAILTEPIGNSKVSNSLNEMGNCVITMCIVLFLTSIMFLVYMTIIIGIGELGL